MTNIFTRIQQSVRQAADWSQANMRKLVKRNPPDAMAQIAGAAGGLLYSSESDYPLTPFTWKDEGPLSPEVIIKAANLPPGTPVTQVDLDTFLAPMLRLREGAAPEAKARVARYQKLVDVLRKNLSDLTVYKLGKVEMPTFIVGHLPNGAVAGLRTTVVET